MRAKVLEGELRAYGGAGAEEALRRGKCLGLRLKRLLGLEAGHAGPGNAGRLVAGPRIKLGNTSVGKAWKNTPHEISRPWCTIELALHRAPINV